jgi:calcium-dependent protein kinase
MGCLQPKNKELKAQATALPPSPLLHTDIRFKYDFQRVIGRGHYGTVRLACLKSRPGELFAVKTMVRKKVTAAEDVLNREIRILFSLDHPNIIRLHEVFEDSKYVHLVTEYCSGGELLDHLVTMGRYSEHQAALFLHKILLAVNNLHLNKVCHRDLKPENFMFEDTTPNAELKLIDFGLANKFFNSSNHAELGSFVGTPDYVAPEVLQGRYGPKCDMWSVGVMMYVMLSGQFPFAANSVNGVYARVLNGAFSMKSEAWANISLQGVNLLQKLLDVNPAKRSHYQSRYPQLPQEVPC